MNHPRHSGHKGMSGPARDGHVNSDLDVDSVLWQRSVQGVVGHGGTPQSLLGGVSYYQKDLLSPPELLPYREFGILLFT